MATAVIMPKVDMDQETGTIVEWLKHDGDQIKKGEPILVIETDKVAIDVEAPGSGILQGIQANPDEVIPIGEIIAYILEPGEEIPAIAKPKDLLPSSQPAFKIPASGSDNIDATPVARNVARVHNIDLTSIAGTGLGRKVTKSDVQSKLTTSPGNKTGAEKVFATPAAKRTARELDVDITSISGSGPGDRIQVADVLAVSAAVPETRDPLDEIVIPLKGMRRAIAERMTTSYQTVPHITFTVRVDMRRCQEIRVQLNKKAEAIGQPSVSMTTLLVKAVAWALKQHSYLNSTLQDDGIHLLPEINLGVAVAQEAGLIVPVIRNADQKGIGKIADELKDLVKRAREEQLTPTDVAGGTFTISNLGPFGIEQFTAIINPPQAAILAVGSIQPEAFVDDEGRVSMIPMMRITLSVDHRIVDGAIAAYFLRDLRDVLESPELLLW